MRIVLDSSVAVKWEIPELDSDKAIRLRDDFQNGLHELLSVDIFTVEAAHAFTRAERQGRIRVGEAKKLLSSILTTAPQFFAFSPFLARAIDISSTIRIGVYDCLYVALAELEKCDFVTADDKLVINLQKQFPFIVHLSTLP
jgi:predicted nucleic acid-binding protein